MTFQRALLGDGTPAILVRDLDGLRLLTWLHDEVYASEIKGIDWSFDSIFQTALEYHEAHGLGVLRGHAIQLESAFLCGEWTAGQWLVTDLTERLLALKAEDIRRLVRDIGACREFGWRFYDFSAPGAEPCIPESTSTESLVDFQRTIEEFFGIPIEELDDETVFAHRNLLMAVVPALPIAPPSAPGRSCYVVRAEEYHDQATLTRLVAVYDDLTVAEERAAKAQEASDVLEARYGYSDDISWPTGANPFDINQTWCARYSVEFVS